MPLAKAKPRKQLGNFAFPRLRCLVATQQSFFLYQICYRVYGRAHQRDTQRSRVGSTPEVRALRTLPLSEDAPHEHHHS